MEHVLLVIHLILTVTLIGLILIQKSEGGGLGLGGGGGGMGSFASAQSTKNAITKTTTIVAVCFFATSLILAVMASRGDHNKSILDTPTVTTEQPAPAQPPVPAIGGGTSESPKTPTVPAEAKTESKPTVPAPASTPASPSVPLAQ
jgi:preprotein translocase subunit SecG